MKWWNTVVQDLEARELRRGAISPAWKEDLKLRCLI
jgi:hypothetical protein